MPFLCLLAQHRRVDEPVLQERVRHDRLRQACFGFLLTLRLSRRRLGQLRRVLVSGELTLAFGFGNVLFKPCGSRGRVRELDICLPLTLSQPRRRLGQLRRVLVGGVMLAFRYGHLFFKPRGSRGRVRELDICLPLTFSQPRRRLAQLQHVLTLVALTIALRFGQPALELQGLGSDLRQVSAGPLLGLVKPCRRFGQLETVLFVCRRERCFDAHEARTNGIMRLGGLSQISFVLRSLAAEPILR